MHVEMASSTPYDAAREESEGCHLISENYAYALQLILGFAALAGLVVSTVQTASAFPRVFFLFPPFVCCLALPAIAWPGSERHWRDETGGVM